MNLRNFGNEPPPPPIDGGRAGPNFQLARQSSVYSLTFDELKNTMGSVGKDFGSMNMDELLKNIWSAEETQQIMGSSGGRQEGGGGALGGGNLQRQGSLTLPRTLSQKTVDEVWRDISREEGGEGRGANANGNGNGNVNGNVRPNMQQQQQQQRQQTLGEMTLEEFLLKAGVVREEPVQLPAGKPDSMNSLGFGFQPMNRASGLLGNRILESNNQIGLQPLNLPMNGVRPSQQQSQLFSQQPATYTSSISLSTSSQLLSPGIRGGIGGMTDPSMNGNLMQGSALQGGGMGMIGLGAGAVTVATPSPANQLSPDGVGKSNGDTSSVSPVPYMFNGAMRGRKRSGAVDKVVERRQRRMIKNRESAARSRARKQAYTMELEAEVAKLKEENQELRNKQAKMEMQKNQVLEMMQSQQGGKKLCLRRTQTGPW